MTVIDKRLVTNYATLIMAKEKKLEDVREDLREPVTIEIAIRENAILEKGE